MKIRDFRVAHWYTGAAHNGPSHARPVRRRDTSFLSFRARVPADIVDATKGQAIALAFPAEAGEPEHVALVRPGREVKFSLRIRNPAVAKSRRGIALAQLETRWNAIRSGPKPLTHRQIIALSGEVCWP